jgi:hypothetical protein
MNMTYVLVRTPLTENDKNPVKNSLNPPPKRERQERRKEKKTNNKKGKL